MLGHEASIQQMGTTFYLT